MNYSQMLKSQIISLLIYMLIGVDSSINQCLLFNKIDYYKIYDSQEQHPAQAANDVSGWYRDL